MRPLSSLIRRSRTLKPPLKRLVACNERVSCVYVVIVMVVSPTCYIVKFGETDNLRTRMMGLKTL